MMAIVIIIGFVNIFLKTVIAPSLGPSSPEDASAVSKFSNPASSGVFLTIKTSIIQKTVNNIAGTRKTQAIPNVSSILRPQSNAKYIPSDINIPKIAPKTPLSLTWNQEALTFTIATAPKLWKYMFIA